MQNRAADAASHSMSVPACVWSSSLERRSRSHASDTRAELEWGTRLAGRDVGRRRRVTSWLSLSNRMCGNSSEDRVAGVSSGTWEARGSRESRWHEVQPTITRMIIMKCKGMRRRLQIEKRRDFRSKRNKPTVSDCVAAAAAAAATSVAHKLDKKQRKGQPESRSINHESDVGSEASWSETFFAFSSDGEEKHHKNAIRVLTATATAGERNHHHASRLGAHLLP